MKKIKIAQLGINRFSHSNMIFRSITKNSDVFEVAGYVILEDEREYLSELMPYLGDYKELTLDEVLNDPEIVAVTVETEEKHLTKYALFAAEHGKHIHMEKPGGAYEKEFEKLIETVKKNNLVFHTGYMYRYNPVILDTKKRVESGEIGDVICVEAQMNCCEPDNLCKWLNGYPGGMMFFLGCHLTDLVLQFMGEPRKVIPLNASTKKNGEENRDFGMAVFEYDTGYSFAKTSAVEVGGFARRQFVISGTKGTIELKPLEYYKNDLIATDRTIYKSLDWCDRGELEIGDTFDRYDTMMRSFAEYVRGEKKNPFTPDYELMLHKTIMKTCGE